jgi:elongation factor Tu
MANDERQYEMAARAPTPFLLEIEEAGLYLAHYASVAVLGRIVRGTVKAEEALDLVGFAPEPKPVVLRDILADRDIVGGLPFYLLEGVSKQEIHRGQVLVAPGSLRPATAFRAEVLFDERYEHITQQPFQGVCRYPFHIRHTDIFGTLHLPAGKQHIVHGDRFTATIELSKSCALEVGLPFGIGRLLGEGTVLEVIA